MTAEDHILPDILAPDLDIVFVGSAVATASRDAGHYYANPRNAFWRRLHQSGLTPRQLRPQDDTVLPAFGLGLTDLNKTVAQSNNDGLSYDAQGFLRRVVPLRPAIVAFNGKDQAEAFCRFTGDYLPGFGLQDWTIGDSLAFVLPSSSSQVYDAMLCTDTEGRLRPAIEYWHELASLLSREQTSTV